MTDATEPRTEAEAEGAAPLIYLPMDCPVCGRHRVEWDGKVLRCEKCTTSSEWNGFRNERYEARSTPAETLDVERLAKAIHKRRDHPFGGACDSCRREAAGIAAEYARPCSPESDR